MAALAAEESGCIDTGPKSNDPSGAGGGGGRILPGVGGIGSTRGLAGAGGSGGNPGGNSTGGNWWAGGGGGWGEHLVVPVVLAQIHIVLAALGVAQLIGMAELQQYWMKVLYMEDTHNECR